MPEAHRETYERHFLAQAEALQRLVDQPAAAAGAMLAARPWQRVVFVGSGTSRFAGEVAAGVWSRLLGVPASVAATLPFEEGTAEAQLGPHVLIVAISQSGGTLGLVRGVHRARDAGATTVAVTADPGSPLAAMANATVPAHTGVETIYAKTKGFTTTALAASLVARVIGAARGANATTLAAFDATVAALPAHLARLTATAHGVAPTWAHRFAHCAALAVAGSGTLRPAAGEGALKVLEVAKLPVLDYELEESLHGPFNAFGPTTGLVLLASAASSPARARAFLEGARTIGAPALHFAETPAAPDREIADATAATPPRTDDTAPDLALPVLPFAPLAPLLGVVPLQALALHLARARGVDPDRTRYPELYAVFRTKAGHGREGRPDPHDATPHDPDSPRGVTR